MFGWAADFDGCGYYRVTLPAHALRAAGHRVDTSTSLRARDEWRVIIGQRVSRADASALWQRHAEQGRRLVFEVDDDLWHLPPDNPGAGFYDEATRQRMTDNAAAASVVTCTTPRLAELLRGFNPNVRVVPNYIDAALLTVQRRRNRRVTIGWAGSNTHAADLKVAARPLWKLLAARPQIDLHLIGADYRHLTGGRHTPWARPTPNYYRLIDFDIGIAPLADTPFNQSKSPIKALEYAALGIPVVASNVGPYAEFVQHGVTGFLADTAQDWTRYLRALASDVTLRERMGAAAREQAAEWTIQGHAYEWDRIVEEVAA